MTKIKILSRVKPNLTKNNNDSCVKTYENQIMVQKPQKSYAGNYNMTHKYKFDKVFHDKCINMDVYNELGIDMLMNVLKYKKNVTFYVYGQTGSGKTHTILGSPKEHGFLHFLLSDILEMKLDAKISFIEIYNNKCYDILNEKKQVFQREDYENKFIIQNLKHKFLKQESDIKDIQTIISENRKVGVSSENSTSSRSHLQITIDLGDHFLRILDLAGCEKAKLSICHDRKQFKENGDINQSLFALKECIRSLVEKKTHIPYRRCELTKMLRHSFTANSSTYILSTIPQDAVHSHTTVDVLNYVNDMKNLKKECVRQNKMPLCNHFVQGSPRFKHIFAHKEMFMKYQKQEHVLFEKMLQKQSSKVLLDDYLSIMHKKKKLLEGEK